MSFWKSLFSSGDTVSKTVDAVINTGDALVFTDEEKSIANQKMLDWTLEFHKASSGSNLARRWIAIMTTAVFLMLVMLTFGAYAFDLSVAGSLATFISDTLVVPMGMIMAFYFTSGMVRDWKK